MRHVPLRNLRISLTHCNHAVTIPHFWIVGNSLQHCKVQLTYAKILGLLPNIKSYSKVHWYKKYHNCPNPLLKLQSRTPTKFPPWRVYLIELVDRLDNPTVIAGLNPYIYIYISIYFHAKSPNPVCTHVLKNIFHSIHVQSYKCRVAPRCTRPSVLQLVRQPSARSFEGYLE